MFAKMKIKTKMMLSLCSVILLMYGVTIFLVMRNTNAIIEEEAIGKTDNLALYYGSLVKGKIDKGMHIAEVIAQNCQG